MEKKNYAVRVIVESVESEIKSLGIQRTSDIELFIEQLRYMGIINICEKTTEAGHMVIDIYAPKGISNSKTWAEMNAKRMTSFGINAAAVPAWK